MKSDFCHLCGEKLPASVDKKTSLVCPRCGGQDVYFDKKNHLGWMYLDEKETLDKFPGHGLTAIIELICRAQMKAKKAIAERKEKIQEQMDLSTCDVALWGATNSGKSWLFNAFVRKMLKYQRPKMTKKGVRFSFWGFDERDQEIPIDHESIVMADASQGTKQRAFVFRREATLEDDKKVHPANSQTHYIHLFDEKGSVLFGDGRDHDFAMQTVANSQFLIITISPTDDARQLITALATLENAIGKNTKHIAVCFTKADKYPQFFDAKSHPSSGKEEDIFEKLLDVAFPGNSDSICKKLVALRKAGHQVQYFCVSACGFDHEGKPNINVQANVIQHDAEHEPVNVELPFLWLFDMIENGRLEPDLTSLYAYLANGTTTPGSVIRKRRAAQYRSYKKMLGIELPDKPKNKGDSHA